jgi:hypothetical protein
MIGGLFAFLILYLGLIALAVYFAYILLHLSLAGARGQGIILIVVLKFGGLIASGLFALFLIKGLFKGQRVPRAVYLPLKQADHPELFDFIHRIHWETESRAPRRVYVCPDVNAALIYNTSLLNLIVPPRKDLLIGLGLVNTINLIEFKAVLAHEFGHFAQRSVSFGSYLYVANKVMHDVI